MKVEFIDREMNVAVVTRGFLWWRRSARVYFESGRHSKLYYEATGRECDTNVWYAVYTRRQEALGLTEEEMSKREWVKTELPKARLVPKG